MQTIQPPDMAVPVCKKMYLVGVSKIGVGGVTVENEQILPSASQWMNSETSHWGGGDNSVARVPDS